MNKPTLSKLITVGIVASVIFSSTGIPANGGTYTRTFSEHVDFARSSSFKYSGALLINGQICTGVLIRPQIVLTSAHCLSGMSTVYGQFMLNNSSLKTNIDGAIPHEYWELFGSLVRGCNNVPSSVLAAEDDIAVLHLENELRPTPTVFPLFSSPYLGIGSEPVRFITAGVGERGNGSTGPIRNSANSNLMLGGENNARVSASFGSYSQAIFYDLDLVSSDGNTSNSRNSDGLPGLPLEYLPASGDSGSPLYVGPFLFGLHSRRQCVTPFGSNTFVQGRYGNIGFATPLTVHEDWISNAINWFNNNRPRRTGTTAPVNGRLRFRVYLNGTTEADAEPGTTEIDASEIPFQYSVTPDTFDKVASPETLFSAFSSEVALSVTNGQPGTNVVISGSRFTGATSVAFNGSSASFRVDSDTQITATVPTGTSTGPVTVVTPIGTARSVTNFSPTFAVPILAGFIPTSGAPGTTVRITGAGLQGTTAVVFYNGKNASFTPNADGTEITVTVPNGAVSGKFQIQLPSGRLVSPSKFIVTP